MDQPETWHAGRPRPWPHCVRWGPSFSPKRGHSPPHKKKKFGPCLLWPNGLMDQDTTWYGGSPRPGHVVLDWAQLPPKKGGTASSPIFCVRWGPSSSAKKGGTALLQKKEIRPISVWPDGLMDQDTTWYGGRPQSRPRCVRWGPAASQKRGHSPLAHFWPMSIVAKRSPISATAEQLFNCRVLMMGWVGSGNNCSGLGCVTCKNFGLGWVGL